MSLLPEIACNSLVGELNKSWSSFGVTAANYVWNVLLGENYLHIQFNAQGSVPWAQHKAVPPWLSI